MLSTPHDTTRYIMCLWLFLLSQNVTLHALFVHNSCLLGGSWKFSKCQQISLWRCPFYIENLCINFWSQQLMAQSCNQQAHILLVINASMAGKQERMPIIPWIPHFAKTLSINPQPKPLHPISESTQLKWFNTLKPRYTRKLWSIFCLHLLTTIHLPQSRHEIAC